MTSLRLILLFALYPLKTIAWLTGSIFSSSYSCNGRRSDIQLATFDEFESLNVMDIVIFSINGEERGQLGAVQEDGTIAPLSAWTLEPAFGDTMEFVVDEELRFPGFTSSQVQVVKILDERVIGYGSRQVGGGKGPRNPHGEESELLYYIDRNELSDIGIVVNPDLEVRW